MTAESAIRASGPKAAVSRIGQGLGESIAPLRNTPPATWQAILSLVLLILLPAGFSLGQDVTTRTNVRYGPHPRNVLDVWQVAADAPTGVLIYFHGGGFVGGDKAEARRSPVVTQCLASGITVVSANYRFVQRATADRPAVTYTAPREDALRVVQFVRSQARAWNLEPSGVAVSGTSAGAVMALWVALRDDAADPHHADPVSRLSTRVQAAVPYAGPTTLDPDEILQHVGGPPSIHSSLPPFYGVDSVDDLRQPALRPAVRDASPIQQLTPDDPPLYLIYPTPLAEKPLAAYMPSAISIHHANFGRLLQQACEKQQVRCLLKYVGSEEKTREVDFLKEVFQARAQPARKGESR